MNGYRYLVQLEGEFPTVCDTYDRALQIVQNYADSLIWAGTDKTKVDEWLHDMTHNHSSDIFHHFPDFILNITNCNEYRDIRKKRGGKIICG